jgi:AraC-like DNA-binding protein
MFGRGRMTVLSLELVILGIGIFVLACAAITFFKAVEQVLIKNPRRTDISLAMLLACMSYVQMALGFYLIGATSMIPQEIFMIGLVFFIMSSYLAAPLAFFYYNALVNYPSTPARDMVHLLPAVAMTVLFTPYLLTRPEEYRLEIWRSFFFADHGAPVYIIFAVAVIGIAAYLTVILKMEIYVRSSEKIKYAVRSLIVVTAGLLVAPVTLMAGFLIGWMWLSALGALLVGVNNLLFILAHVRYQDFFEFLGKELRRARYRKSLLKGIDTAVLLDRLNYLMNEEKYYHDFDISIKSTAEELSITPHQLSMYLNKKLHVDFRNYINRFRVEEAKQLLAEKLDHNVLTIGYHVGFGSKTSFNVTFKELTGKTPSEFRDDCLRKAGQPEASGTP